MAFKTISVLAFSALAALSTVSAVPQDIDNPLPTDINALLSQANIDLTSGMAEAASLFNDPAFQASISNAALSFSEFAEKNPAAISAIFASLSAQFGISADNKDKDNEDEHDHDHGHESVDDKDISSNDHDHDHNHDDTSSSSGAPSTKPLAGMVVAAGLAACAAFF
ncbi:hypothetical protein GGF37_002581 [Kickxella alabastrina]|nr:hypothetical protein GGF37_002581 [Kickxella alabastrina]